MQTEKCYLCFEELTINNQSWEHIIPNSVGGRLKSKSLICSKCNHVLGDSLDREFSIFAGPLASKFKIKKERGDIPNFIGIDSLTGKEVLVRPGWSISPLHPERTYNGNSCEIKASTKRRLLDELQRDITQFKKLGYKLEIEEMKRTVSNEQKQITIQYHLNEQLFLRSICKIFSNYYLFRVQDSKFIQNPIEYIKADVENFYVWFHDAHASRYLHNSNPYHILFIKGRPREKSLYGYLEIFGKKGFVCMLNPRYDGPTLDLDYTFDPIKVLEIKYKYDIDFKISDIFEIISRKIHPDHFNI